MFDNRLQPSNEPLIPSAYTTTEQAKPLFTLTAEEVEIVRYHLTHKKKALDSLLCQMDNDEEKDNEEYRRWESQYNEISYLLTRIKQWQDEQANNNHS